MKRILKDCEIAVCQPWYLNTAIQNNALMTKENPKELVVDQEKAMKQFGDFMVPFNMELPGRVYQVPVEKNLQDAHYVSNAGMTVHHLTKGDERVAVLAKFRAPGRPGEEKVLKPFLESWGFKTFQCPFFWEGEAETKWIRDKLYIGGWGKWDPKTGLGRSEQKAYAWMREKFGMIIIEVQETDPELYHLDCSVLRLDDQNVVVSNETLLPQDVKRIQNVVNVVPVNRNDAHLGLCNSVILNKTCFNASCIKTLKKGTPEYEQERHKNDTLEKICAQYGLEPFYVEITEAEKSGASLSCCVMYLMPNRITTWSEPWIGKG